MHFALLTPDFDPWFEQFYCDDMFCSCCFAGPLPLYPFMVFWRCCTMDCKSTNSFQFHGHYYTFHDKDTMYYHYCCCPVDKFVRKA